MYSKESLLLILAVFGWFSSAFASLTTALESKGCKETKLDLVIVLDSSGSVGFSNFARTRNFTREIINNVNIAPNAVRIAVVRYSTRATVITHLNDHMDKQDKVKDVDGMRFMSGVTYTDKALELVETSVLTPENGDRPDVKDFIILTTDGASNRRERTEKFAANLKRRQNLTIMVIGIGGRVDQSELYTIASDPSYVYRVAFSTLWKMVQNVSQVTCPEQLTSTSVASSTTNTSTIPPSSTPARQSSTVTTATTTTTTATTPTTTTPIPETSTVTKHNTRTSTTTSTTSTTPTTTPKPETSTIVPKTATPTRTTTKKPINITNSTHSNQSRTTMSHSQETDTPTAMPTQSTAHPNLTTIESDATTPQTTYTTIMLGSTTTPKHSTTAEYEKKFLAKISAAHKQKKTVSSSKTLTTVKSKGAIITAPSATSKNATTLGFLSTSVSPQAKTGVDEVMSSNARENPTNPALAPGRVSTPDIKGETTDLMTLLSRRTTANLRTQNDFKSMPKKERLNSTESPSSTQATSRVSSNAPTPVTFPGTFQSSHQPKVDGGPNTFTSSNSGASVPVDVVPSFADPRHNKGSARHRGSNDDEDDFKTLGMAGGLGALGLLILVGVTVCLVYILGRRRKDDDDDRKPTKEELQR